MQLNESNFIYGQIDEQSLHQNQIQNKQTLQSNHIVNHMNPHQQKPQKMKVNSFQSKLIIVKQIKSTKSQEESNQEIQMIELPNSNNQVSKDKLPTNYQQNLIFSYEESQELQEQPQSSIRKLYKAMKRQESHIQKIQEEKVVEINSQSHLYEQDSEQEEIQQIQNKTQIRSKSLRQIVLFKVPKTKLIKCFVKIANDSFFTLQNVFHFYLVQEKQLLMTARKKRFRITSKYQIFGKTKQHVQKLAIARSNYSRTEYKLTLLNKIQQKTESSSLSSIIKVTKVQQDKQQTTYVEEEKCYLSYEPNILGFSQQKVDIIKPKKKIDKTDRFSDIKSTFQNCQFERIQKFGNRFAEKDSQGKLVLDFKDKNITYSTKNIIVQNQFGQACMLLGKRRDDLFMVDVMSPFNFLQSFFVAICNLDRKLFAH